MLLPNKAADMGSGQETELELLPHSCLDTQEKGDSVETGSNEKSLNFGHITDLSVEGKAFLGLCV